LKRWLKPKSLVLGFQAKNRFVLHFCRFKYLSSIAFIDRAGQHSIQINRQWRICFTWDEGVHTVEIVDYH